MKIFGLIILILASALGFYQNCAQPSFQLINNDYYSMNHTLTPEDTSFHQELPRVQLQLMSANQVFQSKLALTNLTPSPDLLGEFNIRASSFSDQGNIHSINSPYLLSNLSLSATFCQVLYDREVRTNTYNFFFRANNNRTINQLTNQEYLNFAGRLSSAFRYQSLTPAEQELLLTYKREFLDPNMPDSARQHDLLIISTCALLLGGLQTVIL
ncbi:MAG: hypothetical protein NZ480_04710 [Bdellovibrionaceae bacterium]|nr:hypothetical protein [Pseudobdellovibrionaceae bacterium]MDW8190607.1 hypothetical protein [Pseudobdellovibrionaceae bacterium]